MGAFDDLIPKSDATASIGAFDDLIPQEQPHNTPQQAGNPYGVQPQGISALSKDEYEDLPSNGLGILSQAAQGASLGFADEGQAAVVSMFSNKTYKQVRDEIREFNREFAEENPGVALGANLVGAALTGGAGLAKTGIMKGGSMAAQAAKASGVVGTAAGVGFSEGETLGEVVVDGAKGGVTGLALGYAGGKVAQKIGEKITQNAQLKRLLETNPDSRVAKLALNESGKVVKDRVAIEAIDQGFDQGVVSVVKGASKTDKSLMRKMVGIYRAAKNNPKVGIKERPLNVIGERIAQRYKHVTQVNRKAGTAIDKAAESLKGEAVEVTPFVDDFVSQLDDIGVKLKTDGKIRLDFKDSDIEGLAGAQKILNRVVTRMSDTKTPDAYDVHRLKRYIDNNVTYGAGNKTGAEKQAENLIKRLRHNMDEMLDGRFPDYDDANTLYATTKNALSEVDSLIGKSSNAASDNFDKSLGTLARRISSNAMSGGRVDDAYSGLNQVATATGGKFGDDLDTLLVFANEMERVLPTQARTSLQGVTESAVGQTARAVSEPRTFFGEKVMKALSKTRDDDTRLKALRTLLAE